jgi:osmotically inducible protein OsmC
MPIAARRAEVVWEGTLEQGNGSFTVGDWVVGEVPVTWESRTRTPGGNTSPEELLAASHASCYAMALSQVLDQGGAPPERLEVAATCTLDLVGSDFRITRVDLDVRGRVPGLDEEGFRSAAEEAEQECPVSNALRGNVDIQLNATLEG